MLNMFDIINQAQNGEAMDNMARMFGIDRGQAETTVEAMLPAFNEAMRRNAKSVDQVQQFWGDVSKKNYEQFFDDPNALQSNEVFSQGNEVLGQLFGSKDVSRAVADQASAMSGLGNDVVKRMLPMVAAMMMGGLNRNGATNPLQQMLEQMMSGASQGMAPGLHPFDNPALQNTPMGGFVQGMLNKMMKGDETPGQDGSNQAASGQTPPAGEQGFDPGGIIDMLFDAGRKQQDANTQAMGQIFEQFMGKR